MIGLHFRLYITSSTLLLTCHLLFFDHLQRYNTAVDVVTDAIIDIVRNTVRSMIVRFSMVSVENSNVLPYTGQRSIIPNAIFQS